MRWRNIKFDDLKTCLEIFPELFDGVSLDDHQRAWSALLARPSFRGVIIEIEGDAKEWKAVGSGASVFIREDVARKEIDSPRRGLTRRILTSLLSSQPLTLSTHAIAKANASDGIHVVTLWARCGKEIRAESLIQEIRQLLAESFSALHGGYYFKAMLFEVVDADDHSYALDSRVCQIVDFPDRSSQTGRDQGRLAIIDAVHVRALPGSIIGRLFTQRRPLLKLRPVDQHLLLAAFDGAPDRELTSRLNLTLPGVKRRWASLYQHLQDTGAVIFSRSALADNGARGMQKRHEVLSYIRDHPEELRPYLETTRQPAERC